VYINPLLLYFETISSSENREYNYLFIRTEDKDAKG